MSRINKMVSAPGSLKSNDEADQPQSMPSGIRKTRRSKAKVAKSISSAATVTTARSNDDHPYLGDSEKTAIEKWNDTVPKKSTRPHGVPDGQDSVIQAYLEAKLSLFRNAGVTNDQDAGNQDTRSTTSTQS